MPSVIRQSGSVIRLAVGVGRDCQRGLRYGQLTRCECLGCIVSCHILTRSIDDSVGLSKLTSVCVDGLALCRSVSNGQDIAVTEAFNRIVIGVDCCTGAGDGRHKRTTLLVVAVVSFLYVLHSDLQRTLCHSQRAESSRYLVVAGLRLTPIDAIGVVAGANRSLGPSYIERDGVASAEGDRTRAGCLGRSPIAADVRGPVTVVQSRTLALRQSCAIVYLLIRRGSDSQRQRIDSEKAVTSINRNRVVRVVHNALFVKNNRPDRRFLQ